MHGGDGDYEYVDAAAPDWPPPRAPQRVTGGAGLSPAAPRAVAALHRRARRRAAALLQEAAAPPPALGAWSGRLVGEVEFCAIDLETTGGGSDWDDEILEIGAIVLGADALLGREFATLVAPRRPISTAARAVHGIADAALVGAPRLEEALPWLAEMARARVLVFHNAGFDLPFLQRALAEANHGPFDQPVVDTLVLVRRLLGAPAALAAVAARLGLAVGLLHRALEDARTTARVLAVLLDILRQAGVVRLEAIPGIGLASAQGRARMHARLDPLVERLENAIARRERLHMTYHAAAGVAPLDLHVAPRQLVAGVRLLVHDLERDAPAWLELARIGRVRAD